MVGAIPVRCCCWCCSAMENVDGDAQELSGISGGKEGGREATKALNGSFERLFRGGYEAGIGVGSEAKVGKDGATERGGIKMLVLEGSTRRFSLDLT